MAHQIGLISDVHGNTTALQAVLADATALGVDEYWFLGDIVMPGPGAQDLLDLMDSVNTTACVLGNWDDTLLEIMRGEADPEDPTDVYATQLARYVINSIGDAGLTRIAEWPLRVLRDVAGTVVSLSHNLPTKNYGPALSPQAPTENFDRLFEGTTADIGVIGHTHQQLLRYGSDRQMIINPGSVGQPFGRSYDPRAQYAVLTIDQAEVGGVAFRKVAYDTQAELDSARDKELPYIELYQEQLEVGRLHTHDRALLDEINRRFGYTEAAAAFLANRH